MEHPNRSNYDEQPNSSLTLVIGALIIVLAVAGYFAWAGGYLGPHQPGTAVTAQTPTRKPVMTPNVTPNKPVNNTPATNTPRPE